MKKLLALATVLFAALMLTSAPASAQEIYFGGHHSGLRIGVGVAPLYPAYASCGYDQWNRPIPCQVAPEPYYGDCYNYSCAPVFPYYGYNRFYGYDRRYYGPRFNGPRYDYNRGYDLRGGARGSSGGRGGNGGGHRR